MSSAAISVITSATSVTPSSRRTRFHARVSSRSSMTLDQEQLSILQQLVNEMALGTGIENMKAISLKEVLGIKENAFRVLGRFSQGYLKSTQTGMRLAMHWVSKRGVEVWLSREENIVVLIRAAIGDLAIGKDDFEILKMVKNDLWTTESSALGCAIVLCAMYTCCASDHICEINSLTFLVNSTTAIPHRFRGVIHYEYEMDLSSSDSDTLDHVQFLIGYRTI